MRLRVVTGDQCVQDVKAPKHRRDKIREMATTIGVKANDETRESMCLTIGDVQVSGILKGVETTAESGEEIIVLKF